MTHIILVRPGIKPLRAAILAAHPVRLFETDGFDFDNGLPDGEG